MRLEDVHRRDERSISVEVKSCVFPSGGFCSGLNSWIIIFIAACHRNFRWWLAPYALLCRARETVSDSKSLSRHYLSHHTMCGVCSIGKTKPVSQSVKPHGKSTTRGGWLYVTRCRFLRCRTRYSDPCLGASVPLQVCHGHHQPVQTCLSVAIET